MKTWTIRFAEQCIDLNDWAMSMREYDCWSFKSFECNIGWNGQRNFLPMIMRLVAFGSTINVNSAIKWTMSASGFFRCKSVKCASGIRIHEQRTNENERPIVFAKCEHINCIQISFIKIWHDDKLAGKWNQQEKVISWGTWRRCLGSELWCKNECKKLLSTVAGAVYTYHIYAHEIVRVDVICFSLILLLLSDPCHSFVILNSNSVVLMDALNRATCLAKLNNIILVDCIRDVHAKFDKIYTICSVRAILWENVRISCRRITQLLPFFQESYVLHTKRLQRHPFSSHSFCD